MFSSEMPAFARAMIYLHAVLGLVVLLSGAAAVATKKGGGAHKRAGRVFTWTLVAAIGASLPAIWARHNLFLALVAPFSLHMVLRGWRIARARREAIPKVGAIDWLLLGFVAIAATGLVGLGVTGLLSGKSLGSFSGVCLGLGLVAGRLAWADFRALRSSDPMPLKQHATTMLGAYTAAVTAFVAVNFPQHSYSPVLVWLTPVALGVGAIAYWTRRLKN